MSEDAISREMYVSARDSSEVHLLSWQAVSGKSYFTRDVRLRVGQVTMAPDLIVVRRSTLWIIEIKGSHAEALVTDEPKLRDLRDTLTDAEIRHQVARRARVDLGPEFEVALAVAYSAGEPLSVCDPEIAHIAWEIADLDLASVLDRLQN